MKSFFLLLILIFLMQDPIFQLKSTDKNVPLIALVMQPADEGLNASYYKAPDNFNFIADNYIYWFSQTGAMPLLVPFDLPLPVLERIIRDSDMLFLPGGGTPLVDDDMKPTFYQERVTWMVKLAEKINDEGKVFPVMGTCLGFQQLSIIYSEDPSIWKCDLKDLFRQHPIIKGKDFEDSKIFSLFNQTILTQVFDKGGFYYEHYCRVTIPDFESKLQDKMYLTGISKTDKGESFVASFEHKKYPFFGHQYHPEINQYDTVSFLYRDIQTLKFMRDMAMHVADMAKPFAKNIDDVSDFIRGYFYLYHEKEKFPGDDYEGVYMVQSYSERSINH